MRIAITALSAVAGEGIVYLNQLFRYLSKIDKENEYLNIATNPKFLVVYFLSFLSYKKHVNLLKFVGRYLLNKLIFLQG